MLAHSAAVDQHRHHARTAHARGIDHDRVQAGHTRGLVPTAQVADRPHHQWRTDRHHLGHRPARTAEQLLQRAGHKPRYPERTIVGRVDDIEQIAELGLQGRNPPSGLCPEHQVRAAETGDQRDVVPHQQMLAHDRVHRRQAEPTCGEHHRRVRVVGGHVAGPAERPGDAREGLADRHRVDLDAACAHALNHQADRPGFGIPVGQRQRDQLAVGSWQHPDELPRLRRHRDQRRLHRELHDPVAELGLAHDRGLSRSQLRVRQGRGNRLLDHVRSQIVDRQDLPCRRLSVARSQDRCRPAAGSVAAGVHTGQRRLLRACVVEVDRAPRRGLQPRLRVLDDRVGGVAQCHDDQVRAPGVRAASGHRPAPSGTVGLPEFHLVELCRSHEALVVAHELDRRAKLLEHDPLFEGMFLLLDARGHLGLGAPVDNRHVAAEPAGGARGIHRRVAAADDQNLLAVGLRQRGLVVLPQTLHEVHAGEELVGRHDVEQVLAGHVHEAR